MLKSENARQNGWTFVDIRGRDLGSFVREAQARVREAVDLPPGYSISWSGQYEYMLRAQERLAQVVPLTLAIIFVLLDLIFRRAGKASLVMLSLPFALVGGMVTAPPLSLSVTPAIYLIWRRREVGMD